MLSRKGRFPVVFTVNNVNLLPYIAEDGMQGELSAREARIAKYTRSIKNSRGGKSSSANWNLQC